MHKTVNRLFSGSFTVINKYIRKVKVFVMAPKVNSRTYTHTHIPNEFHSRIEWESQREPNRELKYYHLIVSLSTF